jgi:hypothetical protein
MTKEILDNLKKKQDEEFDKKFVHYSDFGHSFNDTIKPDGDCEIKHFIDKVRSETAEAVAREERDRIWTFMAEWIDNLGLSEKWKEVSNIIFDVPASNTN